MKNSVENKTKTKKLGREIQVFATYISSPRRRRHEIND